MKHKIILQHTQTSFKGDRQVAEWYKEFVWNFVPQIGMWIKLPGMVLQVTSIHYDTTENEFWVDTQTSPQHPALDNEWEISEKLEGWSDFVEECPKFAVFQDGIDEYFAEKLS